MVHTPRWRVVSTIVKAAGLLLFSIFLAVDSHAGSSSVRCRSDLANVRRDELSNKLRTITGWHTLGFDENGGLRVGNAEPSGGSAAARTLISAAISGGKLIVLEDASNRIDVVFCQVLEARWTKGEENKPPVWVILIDFADFSHVTGDRAALAAFNVGWGVLHEIDHVVRDSVDSRRSGEAGECEDAINKMRRECGLAERAEYFFSYLPSTTKGDFITRYVRIAFDQHKPGTKKKRYWVVWDAAFVGGLSEEKQIAARR